jgi:hypothetical protein
MVAQPPLPLVVVFAALSVAVACGHGSRGGSEGCGQDAVAAETGAMWVEWDGSG